MELWKKIPDFDYAISTLGRCKRLEGTIIRKNGKKQHFRERIIKPLLCSNKYLEYNLNKGGKQYPKLAHRLVAQAFIPNPLNKREVNHLNEDVQDNRVENLEWVTPKENANYGLRNYKCREANRNHFKAVEQYTKDGKFIKRYECLSDAAKEIGIYAENISRAARGIGNRKAAKGYIWKFVEQGNQNRRLD